MGQDEQKTQGVDVGEFLEFYLLDSQEQVDKLGSGLLQLEKEGSNIGLINDLFRSAHSLKGASGTMGFTPIVALTHAAEDLLDRLRQGKMDVSLTVIDTLLGVTDRVRAMLAQVTQHQEISVQYDDLVGAMKELVNGNLSGPQVSVPTNSFAETSVLPGQPAQLSGSDGDNPSDLPGSSAQPFTPYDFGLSSEDWEKIKDAHSMGHEVFQVEVVLAPDTLMKAVRAVMTVQRIESLGSLVKLSPSVEELESGKTEIFFMLVISDESPAEIREEILGVSEISEVSIHPYPVSDDKVIARAETLAGNQEAAASVVANVQTISPNLTADSGLEQNKQEIEPDRRKLTVVEPAALNTGEGNNQVHTIRVDTVRMDNLINLVGEMVITRTRLVQVGLDLKSQYKIEPLVNNLIETNVYLGRLMNDLQESVMRLRMVPIGTVFNRFPRLVRDLARKTGKEIDLVLKGEDTELDKTVVEVIGDPLMHLIRNSVDHGIESPEERKAAGKPDTGRVTLDAFHEGNHIVIIVSDDGAGLPLDKIRAKGIAKGLVSEREELSDRDVANLIFLPGFSTADKVTDISGRGVGMDVVKKALNNLGGMIDIDTRKGQGTTFIIRLPLTLAIIQALLVEVGEEIYAVPLSSVLETLLVNRSDIKTVGGLPMVQLRGNTLPLISLQEKFDLPVPEIPSEEVFVVVVGLGDKALGLVVDTLRGQQEIVIKTLGDLLNNLPGIAGATILGDGKVTLILDIGSLIQDILVARKG